MLDIIIKEASLTMTKTEANFNEALKKIHVGRAASSLVEDINVHHYNSVISLKQLAMIAVPDPAMIVVTPWDKATLGAIEVAIRETGLNLAPVNDGSVVRVSLPPLSAERRADLMKLIEKSAEEAKVGLRQVREEAWNKIKDLVKRGDLTEDDRYRGEQDLNKMIAEFNDRIAAAAKRKEELLTQ
ncbi:ribosome recycling factor [Candidatus Berkelbacteria bacterium]|nr:ribosome recycling factor [Candidatus Berkelbacteria bacterium]